MNWKELKDFCNSLSDEQLQFPVRINREEKAIVFLETEILTENYYIGEEDEGCYPESEAYDDIEKVEYNNIGENFFKKFKSIFFQFRLLYL